MSSRAGLALLAAALAAFGPAAPAGAARPITPPAPEFPEGLVWVNSAPFSLRTLRGKRVVLLTFMNGASPNFIRTLPVLKRWWDQYSLEGLMIIGVHSPDYGFDRDPLNVRKAVKRLDVKFPVVIDTNQEVWKAYKNDGWPAHYLLDAKGLILHDRVGEGGYQEFEEEILSALDRFSGYRPKKGYKPPKDAPRTGCQEATKAFYLGERRGKKPVPIRPHELLTLVKARDGEVGLQGSWSLELESLQFTGTKRDMKSRLRLIYQGAEALAVMSPPRGGPARVYLQQDNAWLHAGNANTDVQWDDEDHSYVLVDTPRLYYLTKNRKQDMRELDLLPVDQGLGVAGFEFSDYCQTDYDHR